MDERTHARYMSDIAYFLSKMEAEPNSSYFIPIALAYNKLEKYDETIAMCKTAVERFPSNCAAKTFLAEAYVYKGFFDQARELLFDVTAEDDNNYKALKLLGIICKEKGDNTEALKYLTGAFIRSPEDAEVRKMIDELGGTLNPGEIYDERMKRQSQNAAESEEDEDLKTYQEIDKRIRNAELIMADLVSDTSINSRNNEDENDADSNNSNDDIPLTAQPEEEVSESLMGNDDDFLPPLTNPETSEEEEGLVIPLFQDEESESLAPVLQEEESTSNEELSEENSTDDLLSALQSEEDDSNDLISALQEEESTSSEELSEENGTDDLLSALKSEEDDSNDLISALQEEENTSSEELSEENSTDDLLSALKSEEDNSNDLISALQEENISEEKEDTLENTDTNKQIDITDKEIENIEDDIDSETKELLNKKVPSSFGSMTYDDMIDDDFQYGRIVDDSYSDSDNPSIDLGESAPFTQSDIMEEILSAVGMTHDDMADNERINILEKDRKLMRLENLLEKVQHNKENR